MRFTTVATIERNRKPVLEVVYTADSAAKMIVSEVVKKLVVTISKTKRDTAMLPTKRIQEVTG